MTKFQKSDIVTYIKPLKVNPDFFPFSKIARGKIESQKKNENENGRVQTTNENKHVRFQEILVNQILKCRSCPNIQ